MKYNRKQIIDEKYLIFIENEEDFNTLKRNGFRLTKKYYGAYCYSESDNSYKPYSTKTLKGTYKPESYNDKILTIHDIELPSRFPFKLTEDNFVKLIKCASYDHKVNLCVRYTPNVFTDTFVMVDKKHYDLMRRSFDEEGQKVLDEIFGADIQEKPFPKFMKSKHDGGIVLFSMPKEGIVVKETNERSFGYKSTDWNMDKFEDIEAGIIEYIQ